MTLRSLRWCVCILCAAASAFAQEKQANAPANLPILPASPALETAPRPDAGSIAQNVPAEVRPAEAPPTPEPSETPVQEEGAVPHVGAIDEGSIESQLASGGCCSGHSPECMVTDFTFDFPKWYVRGEAIWLDRTTQGDLTTASTVATTGSIGNYRIESNAFNTAPGMRVAVGRNFNDGQTYLELAYTGLIDWNSNRALGPETGLLIFQSNLDMGLLEMGLSNGQSTERQFIGYSSTLNDGEVNVRSFMSPNLALIFGVRYLALNEELTIVESGTTNVTVSPGVTVPGPYTATRDTSVENGLLTAQMGGDVYFDITDDIRLNLVGKLGMAGNFSKSTVRQTALVEVVQGIPFAAQSRVQVDEEVVLAGIVQMDAGLDVRLTRNIVVRGGYNFVWLANIAVAPEQFANAITDPNGVQRQIENGAQAILFGPFVGLQVSWGGVD